MKYVLGLLFIATFSWALEVNQEIELTRYMNARYSGSFSKTDDNIAGGLSKGTKGTVKEVKKFNSGNYGFLIEVKDGNFKDQKVWVYYEPKNPSLSLTDDKQKPTDDVDQAQQAQTTRQVPATREPVTARSVLGRSDQVTQALARLDTSSHAVAASDCVTCGKSAPGQSGGSDYLPVGSTRDLETVLTRAGDVSARIKCSHKSDQGMTHAGSIELEINNNTVTKLNAKIQGCEVSLNNFKQVYFDNKNIVLRHANGCAVTVNQNLKVRSGSPVLNFALGATDDCAKICKKIEKGFWQVEMNPNSQNCY